MFSLEGVALLDGVALPCVTERWALKSPMFKLSVAHNTLLLPVERDVEL